MYFCNRCKHIFSIQKNVPGKEGSGYFYCTNCFSVEKIPANTVIHQSVFRKDDVTPPVYDPVLVTHQNYQRKWVSSCGNKQCHKKNASTEVIIVRDDEFNVSYVCTACHHQSIQGAAQSL